MPRFVVLEHQTPADAARGLHWDLMLESCDVLRTWALLGPPEGAGRWECEALADHRVAYLDYEDPISGDRGSVSRWDAGQFVSLSERDGALECRFLGRRLRGKATITKAVAESAQAGQRWILELADG